MVVGTQQHAPIATSAKAVPEGGSKSEIEAKVNEQVRRARALPRAAVVQFRRAGAGAGSGSEAARLCPPAPLHFARAEGLTARRCHALGFQRCAAAPSLGYCQLLGCRRPAGA